MQREADWRHLLAAGAVLLLLLVAGWKLFSRPPAAPSAAAPAGANARMQDAPEPGLSGATGP